MTITVALHQPGVGTWIGSDRRTCLGGQVADFTPKWTVAPCGRKAIAYAGPGRGIHLVQEFQARLFGARDPYDVAARLRQLIQEDGWTPSTEAGDPSHYGGSAIYAQDDGVWYIACDFVVIPIPPGRLWADGSGRDYAQGAAHALTILGTTDGGALVRTAIEAACANDRYCGGAPFLDLLRSAA